MIGTFLLNALSGLLLLLISILPSYALPSSISSSLASVISYGQAFSFIFPISTLITVAGLALLFHLGILGFKLLNWIIGKVRGSN